MRSLLRRALVRASDAVGRAVFGPPEKPITTREALELFLDLAGRGRVVHRRDEPDAGPVERVALTGNIGPRTLCFDFDLSGRLLTIRIFDDGGFNAQP